MRAVRALLVVGFLAILPSRSAPGCLCDEPTVVDAKARAVYAFSGSVLAIGIDYERQQRITTFRVERAFKGEVSAVIRVTSAHTEVACAFLFERGRTYLVFARQVSGRPYTDRCAGNRALGPESGAPPELGSGLVPDRASSQLAVDPDYLAVASLGIDAAEGEGPQLTIVVPDALPEEAVRALASLRKVVKKSVHEREKPPEFRMMAGYFYLWKFSVSGDKAVFAGTSGEVREPPPGYIHEACGEGPSWTFEKRGEFWVVATKGGLIC